MCEDNCQCSREIPIRMVCQKLDTILTFCSFFGDRVIVFTWKSKCQKAETHERLRWKITAILRKDCDERLRRFYGKIVTKDYEDFMENQSQNLIRKCLSNSWMDSFIFWWEKKWWYPCVWWTLETKVFKDILCKYLDEIIPKCLFVVLGFGWVGYFL